MFHFFTTTFLLRLKVNPTCFPYFLQDIVMNELVIGKGPALGYYLFVCWFIRQFCLFVRIRWESFVRSVRCVEFSGYRILVRYFLFILFFFSSSCRCCSIYFSFSLFSFYSFSCVFYFSFLHTHIALHCMRKSVYMYLFTFW